ncbi:MAG: thioredoxin family protein [Planctomycetes bacterium]|nr:thioredoxin family protein [Planctomycetota bacterium]
MKLFAWLALPLLALTFAVAPAVACPDCGCEDGDSAVHKDGEKDDCEGCEKCEGEKAATADKKEEVEEAPEHATIDKKAPDFTLKNADGKEVKLSDYKGKIVVLEWFNFDCPFVKKFYKKSDAMVKQQKKQREAGVVWLTICSNAKGKQGFEEGEALTKRIKDYDLKGEFYLIDDKSTVGRTYQAKTTPHMYVIDKEGKLRYAGAIDSIRSGDSADIEKATNYVDEAIKAINDGKEVATKESKPYGCSVKFAPEETKTEEKSKN